MKNICKNLILILICSSLISCSYQPILDQNEKYLQTGQIEAEEDIKSCTNQAEQYLKQYKAQRAAKEAARQGITGAVIGGIFGFIFGNNTKSLLTGLAVGAGVGAASGALGVAGEGKITPDQIKQRYITNCLARKGYSVIGWQ
ncbi:MAG: cell envelope biogenesis protein OmpA [Pelagibacterales bacterium]|nr:cell envelope biogenesis protein OmpA [Pelagibacterales bacterium]